MIGAGLIIESVFARKKFARKKAESKPAVKRGVRPMLANDRDRARREEISGFHRRHARNRGTSDALGRRLRIYGE